MSRLHQIFLYSFRIFRWELQCTHFDSVTMYVCMHLQYTYSSSLSLSLHHQMARCHMRIKVNDAGELRPVHDVWVENAVFRRSINRALGCMELQAAPSYRPDDTAWSETFPAVLDRAVLFTELFNSGAERYAKKAVELIQYEDLDMEVIRNMLKSLK